jgi:hypothetical protein
MMNFLFSRKCADCEMHFDNLEMSIQIHYLIETSIPKFLEQHIFEKTGIPIGISRISFFIL